MSSIFSQPASGRSQQPFIRCSNRIPMTFMIDCQILPGFEHLIVHTFWLFKWKDDRICVIVINTGQNIVLILDIADLIIHLIISALEFSDKFIRLFQDSCIRFISDFLINIVAVRKLLSKTCSKSMLQIPFIFLFCHG